MQRALSVILGLATLWFAAPAMGQEAPLEETEARADAEAAPDPRAAPDAEPAADPAAEPDAAREHAPAPAPDLDLDADPAPDPDAAPDPEADPAPDPGPPGWTDGKAAGWATLIASLVIGVGGGVLLAIGADDANTVENAAGGTAWAAVEEAYGRAPAMTGAGAVVLGLGAAGTLVGAALLAIHGSEGTWIRASVGPGGVSIRGRF